MSLISQQRLKEILDYYPSTGHFFWKEKVADKVVVGTRAGSQAKNGYRFIRIAGVRYREHQLACLFMLGHFPEQVDHENHVTSDNSWGNLKPSSYAENGKNHPKTKRNSTGFVGVSQRPDGKFVARIYVSKKHVFLGSFDSLEDAAQARKQASILHGFHVNHGS